MAAKMVVADEVAAETASVAADMVAPAPENKKLHAVLVPFPGQGHINPMLTLAKLLQSSLRGLHVTFVNSEYNHRRLLSSKGASALAGTATFRYVTIPDGLPDSPVDANATQDQVSLCHSLLHNCFDAFKKLLERLNSDKDYPPVTVVVSDSLTPFAVDAAKEMGIQLVVFWTSNAASFVAYTHCPRLIDEGIIPFKDPNFMKDGSLDSSIDIPSMKGITLKHMPSFIRTTNKDDIMLNFILTVVDKTVKSHSPIIFNTFELLDCKFLDAVSSVVTGPIYPIGPLQPLLEHVVEKLDNDQEIKSLGSLNLLKEDKHCLQWLNSKEPSSVIYVNFGSITTLTNDQLLEFAWGLADSNRPFLWVIRPDLVCNESDGLPKEFVDVTKDKGLLVSWCDQVKVLGHPATGIFLTHCGWNSTLESICNGVPIICWPFFADQQTGCWCCCNRWGIGLELDSDVKRDGVRNLTKNLLGGEIWKEMKQKAMEWKSLAKEATMSPNGSSYVNLGRLIKHMVHDKKVNGALPMQSLHI